MTMILNDGSAFGAATPAKNVAMSKAGNALQAVGIPTGTFVLGAAAVLAVMALSKRKKKDSVGFGLSDSMSPKQFFSTVKGGLSSGTNMVRMAGFGAVGYVGTDIAEGFVHGKSLYLDNNYLMRQVVSAGIVALGAFLFPVDKRYQKYVLYGALLNLFVEFFQGKLTAPMVSAVQHAAASNQDIYERPAVK